MRTLCVCLILMCVGCNGGYVVPDPPAPVVVEIPDTTTVKVAWDSDQYAGIPIMKAHLELTGAAEAACYFEDRRCFEGEVHYLPLYEFVKELPNGAYKLQVRVHSIFGYWSDWSDALTVGKDW